MCERQRERESDRKRRWSELGRVAKEAEIYLFIYLKIPRYVKLSVSSAYLLKARIAWRREGWKLKDMGRYPSPPPPMVLDQETSKLMKGLMAHGDVLRRPTGGWCKISLFVLSIAVLYIASRCYLCRCLASHTSFRRLSTVGKALVWCRAGGVDAAPGRGSAGWERPAREGVLVSSPGKPSARARWAYYTPNCSPPSKTKYFQR